MRDSSARTVIGSALQVDPASVDVSPSGGSANPAKCPDFLSSTVVEQRHEKTVAKAHSISVLISAIRILE